MNRKTVIVVVLLALVLGCAAGLVVNEAIEPPARAYTGPTFEHRCTKVLWEDIDKPTITNDLGPKGWEMVAMSTAVKKFFGGESVEVITCFKRPLTTGQ
jgi:hypothetical protein